MSLCVVVVCFFFVKEKSDDGFSAGLGGSGVCIRGRLCARWCGFPTKGGPDVFFVFFAIVPGGGDYRTIVFFFLALCPVDWLPY